MIDTTKGYVYILKDQFGKVYVGSTINLNSRVKSHKAGYTKTTSKMTNLDLVLAQEYPSLAIARKIERKIKALKRRDYIEKMIKEGCIKIKI